MHRMLLNERVPVLLHRFNSEPTGALTIPTFAIMPARDE